MAGIGIPLEISEVVQADHRPASGWDATVREDEGRGEIARGYCGSRWACTSGSGHRCFALSKKCSKNFAQQRFLASPQIWTKARGFYGRSEVRETICLQRTTILTERTYPLPPICSVSIPATDRVIPGGACSPRRGILFGGILRDFSSIPGCLSSPYT